MKKNIIRWLAAPLVVLFSLVLSGCGETLMTKPIPLTIWGTFDDATSLQGSLGYNKLNKAVKDISYRKLTGDQYKDDLLNALAAGNGPDMFFIQSSWLPEFKDKISPAPPELISELEVRSNFVDVVPENFYLDNKLYALPLSVDSLALYYNKDIFNSVGIVQSPKTWDELKEDVRKITKINSNGNIERAGIAWGTSNNVNRSSDLLTMLMIQNGANFNSSNRTGNSQELVDFLGTGEKALNFYTQFAQLKSDVYCWNKNMPYSIDAFSEGRAAMMINYSWQMDAIKKKNPKLNFSVAPLPQYNLDSKKNFANYWAIAVARDQAVPAGSKVVTNKVFQSWQYIKYLTMKNNGTLQLMTLNSTKVTPVDVQSDPALDYLKKTGKPAARRDIIEMQLNDPVLNSFAQGNLVAQGWNQKDVQQAENIINEMIDSVNINKNTPGNAVITARVKLTRL